MNDAEQIPQVAKDFGDAATASAHTFQTALQEIAEAHGDYAKKVFHDSSEFISMLTKVKEPAKVIELQSEYLKKAQETFVAEAKKISDLYTDLFKQMTKPFEAFKKAA